MDNYVTFSTTPCAEHEFRVLRKTPDVVAFEPQLEK